MKRPSLDCIKCVIVGDGAVGKTCMLVSYATNKFPSTHVPTVFDNYAVTMTVNDTPMVVVVYDTAGQEEYDRLRVLAYPDTDVFVVCFSVVIPASFENVTEKWVPEIRHHRPATPYILVGTQVDKRDNFHELQELLRNKQKPIAFEQGQSLASCLKAAGYVECSALTQHGLKAVFDTAMTAIIHTRLPVAKKPEKRRCVFL